MNKEDLDMNNVSASNINQELEQNLDLIIAENQELGKKMNTESLVPLIQAIQQSESIFLIAAGRSGFALRGAAMRLMHLGLTTYFVGDTTTPAIKKGDLLIVASGSGTTTSMVRAAEKAVDVGAQVIALTTVSESELAKLAKHTIIIPAAAKQEVEGRKSQQYAGSLFEQFLFLLMDVVFQSLWKLSTQPAEELWERHANLE